MLKTLSRFIVVVAAVAAFAPFAAAQTDQQKLVNEAAKSLSNFMRDPDMSWLQTHIQGARAVIIAPTIAKAGFIFGGSGGRAVVYAREANGKWAGPVFYTLATASVGFQAGISVSEGLTLVMTEKGFNSLLSRRRREHRGGPGRRWREIRYRRGLDPVHAREGGLRRS